MSIPIRLKVISVIYGHCHLKKETSLPNIGALRSSDECYQLLFSIGIGAVIASAPDILRQMGSIWKLTSAEVGFIPSRLVLSCFLRSKQGSCFSHLWCLVLGTLASSQIRRNKQWLLATVLLATVAS